MSLEHMVQRQDQGVFRPRHYATLCDLHAAGVAKKAEEYRNATDEGKGE